MLLQELTIISHSSLSSKMQEIKDMALDLPPTITRFTALTDQIYPVCGR